MSKKKPETIKGVLNKVIEAIEKTSPGEKERISEAWQKTLGNKASKHSRPVGFRRKILTVEVDSSTWLYELTLKKSDLLKKIKEEIRETEIKDIRFKMGDIS